MASVLENHTLKKTRGPGLRELVRKRIHHGSGRFLNPFNSKGHKSFRELIRWKLFSKNRFEPQYERERVIPVNIEWREVQENKGSAVTFIKHASLMIKDDDRFLLIDPVFKGFFGFTDFSPLAFDIREMPTPDTILVTHGHYDHLHMGSLSHFNRKTHVITPLGYRKQFQALKMQRHTQLDWFESCPENGSEIICLPCNHWTMRNPIIGPNTALWSSFLIRTKGGVNIYVSGDTAYFDHFDEIGGEFNIDLAIFNLGAYEPRWFMADSHISPKETVKAFRELGARHLMVVHWGAFRLGDEPVFLPPHDIEKEMVREGLSEKLIHLSPGQTLFYDDHL